jgi:hypothetical protein
MGELKSAYEKALERAGKLGRLSPEEMRERKVAEYAAIGGALAERYLEHGYTRVLDEELGKYEGSDRDVLVEAALSRLAEALSLDVPEATERALQGITTLKPNTSILETERRMRSLEIDYADAQEQAYEQARAGLKRQGAEALDELGITGSAIGDVRIGVRELRRDASQELRSRFEAGLGEVRQELLERARES